MELSSRSGRARVLLISNSTMPGMPFLAHAERPIRDFLGTAVDRVLFIPYAAVRVSLDEYAALVRERLGVMGYQVDSAHETQNPGKAVRDAEAVFVGGGNTFHLLRAMYALGLLEPIRQRAREGMPYMGSSAGSNVACPTVRTTNDMPIVQPPSLDALGLVPFQVNPHYLDSHPDGHQGETREERIVEFTILNPGVHVVGLREGSLLQVEDSSVTLLGERAARIFRKGEEPRECLPGEPMDFLMLTSREASDT